MKRHKIKVYSDAKGDKIVLTKGEVQLVDPVSLNKDLKITLSIEAEHQLVSLIEKKETSNIKLVCIIKYFMKRFGAATESASDDEEKQ